MCTALGWALFSNQLLLLCGQAGKEPSNFATLVSLPHSSWRRQLHVITPGGLCGCWVPNSTPNYCAISPARSALSSDSRSLTGPGAPQFEEAAWPVSHLSPPPSLSHHCPIIGTPDCSLSRLHFYLGVADCTGDLMLAGEHCTEATPRTTGPTFTFVIHYCHHAGGYRRIPGTW